jgi:hypothetical protein
MTPYSLVGGYQDVEEHAASIFYPENGGNRLLQNVRSHVLDVSVMTNQSYWRWPCCGKDKLLTKPFPCQCQVLDCFLNKEFQTQSATC